MGFGPVIDELIDSLRVLPGVGQKSAQRMALFLLERNRHGAERLSQALLEAVTRIRRCNECQNFSEQDICNLCQDTQREDALLCVVESPSDLLAIEDAHYFKGRYFVLNGSLSPLDGRGPEQIGLPKLQAKVEQGPVREIILATNPTIEGEATAHYIGEIFAHKSILITRLAHGIPLGGALGYVDGGTLSHAFSGRKPLSHEV